MLKNLNAVTNKNSWTSTPKRSLKSNPRVGNGFFLLSDIVTLYQLCFESFILFYIERDFIL